MKHPLGQIAVVKRTGTEPFHKSGQSLNFDVLDFWRWSSSDLLSNTMRGVLAEYLVARAIGGTQRARAEWEPFDVLSKTGIRVEVKSSAYLQSWHQNTLSNICFSISATQAWDSATNTFAKERVRQADAYVFCVLAHKDKTTVDPLNLSQWQFWTISTERLNAELGDQKNVSLTRLEQIGAEESNYNNLAAAVESAVSQLVA